MTTPKEALERARTFVSHAPGSNAENTLRMIDEAIASLEGDAVERVARIKSLLASFHRNSCYPEAMTGELNDAAERILASGLVPDEAAIRADEREKCERRVEELDCLYVNDERYPFGGTPADPESAIRREAIKECLAAIRSNRREA